MVKAYDKEMEESIVREKQKKKKDIENAKNNINIKLFEKFASAFLTAKQEKKEVEISKPKVRHEFKQKLLRQRISLEKRLREEYEETEVVRKIIDLVPKDIKKKNRDHLRFHKQVVVEKNDNFI
jgi:hypothetical protein